MMSKKEYSILYILSLVTIFLCLLFILQNAYLTVKINDISSTIEQWELDEN